MRSTATSTVSFISDFHYRSGVAYGLLLDAASPGWPRRVTALDDLWQLLAQAMGVSRGNDAAAAAKRYDASD